MGDGTNYYIYGTSNNPIEQIAVSGGATSYLLPDELGTTRAITNSSGTVAGTFTDDAWGNQTGATGTTTSPFGFAGEYLDGPSGFYYLRARWYNALTGTFLSLDPNVVATTAPYAYAKNGPTYDVDPSGAIAVPGGAVVAARSAWNAGFRTALVAMVAIAGAESSWSNTANNGICCNGLWQINLRAHANDCKGIGANSTNPDANARCAYTVFWEGIHAGQPQFKPWPDQEVIPPGNSVYTNRYVPACSGVCYAIAQAAVHQAGH